MLYQRSSNVFFSVPFVNKLKASFGEVISPGFIFKVHYVCITITKNIALCMIHIIA